MKECTTPAELDAWLDKNTDVIAALDGEESRRFETIHGDFADGLKLVETSNA